MPLTKLLSFRYPLSSVVHQARTIGTRNMSGCASAGAGGGRGRVPIINTLEELRAWRREKRDRKQEVGVVPTMGALHQGHLDLVKRSLEKHPFTVMTLFVNPMQFAPTEDLSRYPRTLQRDLELLSSLLPPSSEAETSSAALGSSNSSQVQASPQVLDETTRISPTDESPLVVFAPATDEMYPLRGDLQDLRNHRGVGVEMRGLGDVMEGASRPQFFKGVATVCTKLFNAVEPDHAYFGQKDIQQALLLKLMVSDLLLSHPTSDNLHILPTTRDTRTKLALSSRNAYLTPSELKVSPILYRSLSTAKESWAAHTSSSSTPTTGEDIVATATSVILAEVERLKDAPEGKDVDLRLDYIEVFDKHTFEPIRGEVQQGREMVIAGAVWVGQTRLIDNLLLGWEVD